VSATAAGPRAAGDETGGGPSIHDCHILVVDDTDFNRTLIGTLLGEAGFRNISYAKDGFEALESIAGHTPDLLILDIMMPGIDGFEVCRRLRADHAYADLPVLVQTALSSSDDRNKAFAAGTTDLVAKPLDRSELLARVRIHLENRVLIRDLRHFRTRIEGELAMARSMCEHLLPGPPLLDALSRASGVGFRSHTALSSEMGGDIWGAIPLSQGRFGVHLLDMAGRGVSAVLNAFRLHTLVHELVPLGEDPAAFLSELNDRVVPMLELGQYATMLYGVVDSAAGSFTYASAAAPSPILLLPGQPPVSGDATGLPVGVAAGIRYEACRLPFPQGAALALHSNAVDDTLDTVEGGGSLVSILAAARTRDTAADAFAAATAALTTVEGMGPHDGPEDDHTLVWLDHIGR
jgi:sigma-B regulation protein RsbU (phosphoserine phosphatase)